MSRILVIEDTPANLALTSAILEGAGHRLLFARDAATGLACARVDAPDLVLMDMRLPGMDGLEATRRLKSDPLTGHLPVIALTASAMKGDEQRMRAAGCAGYVTKPIRYRELLAVVDSVLAGDAGSPAASGTSPAAAPAVRSGDTPP